MGSGFDSAGNNNSPVEEVSLKVSHGNEIRRITFQNVTYASLCEKTAELFILPIASVILKYQDDDGDKITMSSDAELHEAVRLSKQEQKVLRLFVEVKAMEQAPIPAPVFPAPVPAPSPSPAPSAPAPAPSPAPVEPDIYLGPQMRGFVHHGPRFHHPEQHRPFPGPYGGFGGFHAANYNQGTFSPAPASDQAARNWHHERREQKKDLRESWRAMKEENHRMSEDERKAMKGAWKEMKEAWKAKKRDGALTEEERRELKAMKHQLKKEFHQLKSEHWQNAKANKEAWRAAKHAKWEEMKEKKPRFIARHVQDVTIPDGSELPPNTPFLKTWRIRNEGPQWPSGCQLLFVSHKGDNLNGPERVLIKGDVLPGQEIDVSVPLITPGEPGRYVGYYRMVTPDGIKFGQRVWVSFVVKREGEPEVRSSKGPGIASVCSIIDE